MQDTNVSSEIISKLGAIRKQKGISASALAALVGVSRQTIYAVESGSYIPNTTVGLRLAQALDVHVEDLFVLSQSRDVKSQTTYATIMPDATALQPGQAVQVCKISNKLVATPAVNWFFPSSDAVISTAGHATDKIQIRFDQPEPNLEGRVLLAGCDPAMSVIAQFLRGAEHKLILLHQNSSQSLARLKDGLIHIAGTHLSDEKSGESNLAAVNRLFPSSSAAIISFALWQEGLVTALGNPKAIRAVDDLARKSIKFVNREPGSGSRNLIDRRLKHLGINAKEVPGFARTLPGHLAAAWEVKTGNADCCVATEACARFWGLNFVPIETIRYDLVVRKDSLTKPEVRVVLDVINQLGFRRKLASLGGYDTSVTGQRIQ